MPAFVHVFLSVVCLALGAVILVTPKATHWHRVAGKIYAVSMIVMNLTALGIYHLTGHFNLFHFTAILNLALVGIGWAQIIFRRRIRNWLYRHYVYMCWSYVALVAAAFNEGFVRVEPMKALLRHSGNWVILATQAVILAVAAVWITRKKSALLAPFIERAKIAVL